MCRSFIVISFKSLLLYSYMMTKCINLLLTNANLKFAHCNGMENWSKVTISDIYVSTLLMIELIGQRRIWLLYADSSQSFTLCQHDNQQNFHCDINNSPMRSYWSNRCDSFFMRVCHLTTKRAMALYWHSNDLWVRLLRLALVLPLWIPDSNVD